MFSPVTRHGCVASDNQPDFPNIVVRKKKGIRRRIPLIDDPKS
jgi:hypothetical protein